MPADREELIPTRASLLSRLRNWEDQSSWEDFFNTYWRLIYGVARKAGLTDAEAQDVVQETLVSVAKHMPGFRYNPALGSFKAWLLNMTRWRIIDQHRKRPPGAETNLPRHDFGTALVEKVIDPAGDALDKLWEAEWQQNLLEAAMSKVRRRVEPQTFQLFDFYVNKEWSPDLVASKFGVSVEQVYLAKHRMTEMIKEEVRRLDTDAA